MGKIKIALDMDEVIVDLIGNWERKYKIEANIPEDAKIEVHRWDVARSFTEIPKSRVYSMLDEPGMFLNCEPIVGALFYIRKLLKDKRFVVDILTIAKATSAYSEKLEWIERNLGRDLAGRTLGLSCWQFKAELSKHYDVLVEDNDLTLRHSAGSGCTRILFKQTHNKKAEYPRDYDISVDTWKELFSELEALWQKQYEKKK